ncbi:hypothetical protein VKT23_019931 [Stygiomarasmius scandens]|uniref:Zn(2)-C6 fungal-type domain-containing protein n=1 Tax=Marasmiellus scandens TaxID=2682957 RepID=A0ABR1IK48_9AGAR
MQPQSNLTDERQRSVTPDFRDRFPSPIPFDDKKPQLPTLLPAKIDPEEQACVEEQNRMLQMKYQRSLATWKENFQEYTTMSATVYKKRKMKQEIWREERRREEEERRREEEERRREEEERRMMEEERKKAGEKCRAEERKRAGERKESTLETHTKKLKDGEKERQRREEEEDIEAVREKQEEAGGSRKGIRQKRKGKGNKSEDEARIALEPCSYCKDHGSSCRISTSSSRRKACLACVSAKQACSFVKKKEAIFQGKQPQKWKHAESDLEEDLPQEMERWVDKISQNTDALQDLLTELRKANQLLAYLPQIYRRLAETPEENRIFAGRDSGGLKQLVEPMVGRFWELDERDKEEVTLEMTLDAPIELDDVIVGGKEGETEEEKKSMHNRGSEKDGGSSNPLKRHFHMIQSSGEVNDEPKLKQAKGVA